MAEAEIDTTVPESYHPVSPEIVGLVEVVAEPPPVGEETSVSWYCVALLKFTVCVALIVMEEVVTVPVVATLLFDPLSMFHEETLVPVPDDPIDSASAVITKMSLPLLMSVS